MMQATKIRLSPEEKALVLDPAWILTKRSVMEKAGALLGGVAERYQALMGQYGTSAGPLGPIAVRFPKLSRGENYRGLPYMILDYPAVFDKENVFAIRTMFWWGHYFSITLHLKGVYRERYLPALLENIPATGEWHVAVSEDEWTHAVEEGTYVRWDGAGGVRGGHYPVLPYFKIASVLPLVHWDGAADWLEHRFGEVVGWLCGDGGRG